MEHLVRSLGDAESEEPVVVQSEEETPGTTAKARPVTSRRDSRASRTSSRCSSRAASRASTIDLAMAKTAGTESEETTPDMERRFFTSPSSKRFSQLSWSDVADRNIRDKTDAIADIIRNISEQCAAAVEGLHLSQAAAEAEEQQQQPTARSESQSSQRDRRDSNHSSGRLTPHDRVNSLPPTPDLTHRASTAMSMASMTSTATLTPERGSLTPYHPDIDVPTRIMEAEDVEDEALAFEENARDIIRKEGIVNRAGARISAFGTS